MPGFMEKKLKEEYGADSDAPYKIMNSMGAMRGNQETPKGRAMEQKHEADSGYGSFMGKRASRKHGKSFMGRNREE